MATADQYRFAHKDMLMAGLTWVVQNANYLTLNTDVPDSRNGAMDNKLAGGVVTSSNFVGPDYVDPEVAEDEEENPLGKGDVVLYLSGRILQGLVDGAPNCVCLLSDAYVLYMAPVTGMNVVQSYPVFLGPWCISNLQPTEDCEVPPDFSEE